MNNELVGVGTEHRSVEEDDVESENLFRICVLLRLQLIAFIGTLHMRSLTMCCCSSDFAPTLKEEKKNIVN